MRGSFFNWWITVDFAFNLLLGVHVVAILGMTVMGVRWVPRRFRDAVGLYIGILSTVGAIALIAFFLLVLQFTRGRDLTPLVLFVFPIFDLFLALAGAVVLTIAVARKTKSAEPSGEERYMMNQSDGPNKEQDDI